MDDIFELPVQCNGKELLLPARLHQWGYGYKLEIEINGNNVIFERDEERNWRALTDVENNGTATIKLELMGAIILSLEQLFQ